MPLTLSISLRAPRRVVRNNVFEFVAEREIADVLAAQDPFGCDDPCPGSPVGHYPIRIAGDVVCAHWPCGKVFAR